MKHVFALLLVIILMCSLSAAAFAETGQSAFEVLPVSEPNPENPFGVDMNVNMDSIDDFLEHLEKNFDRLNQN